MSRSLALLVAALLALTVGRTTVVRCQTAAATRQTTPDSALEARTSEVASQLRCPVCQGLSIQDSPSELAASMRSLVRDQLAQGRTPEQVKAYFVSKYGEWILLAPKPRGFNLVAYALPIVIVLGGGVLIAYAVRRWTAAGADELPTEEIR